MTLRRRLDSLERRFGAPAQSQDVQPHDEQGSERFARCITARACGELAEGEYLPDMTAGDRALVDMYANAFRVFFRGLEERDGYSEAP